MRRREFITRRGGVAARAIVAVFARKTDEGVAEHEAVRLALAG